jgi:hypothetical protein
MSHRYPVILAADSTGGLSVRSGRGANDTRGSHLIQVRTSRLGTIPTKAPISRSYRVGGRRAA